MKRNAMIGTMAALVLAACTKDGDLAVSDGPVELRLTSGIEVVARGEMQETEIVPDETVWAWVSDAGTGQKLYDAEKLTAQAGGGLSGTTPMYFPQTGNAVNIRALHGTFSGTFESGTTPCPESIGFTVAENQSAGSDAYVKSDLLYAASDNVSRTKNAVPLTFYHMLSKLELKIVRGEGVTDAVTKVTLDGVVVSGTFTPAEGADLTQRTARAAMIESGKQSATMTLGGVFWDEGTKTTNDAIVVPQTVGGKTMTFTLASGGELVYTIPEGKAFESGRKHVYTVTLKGTELSVDSTIEPWDDSEGETEGDATLPPPPPAEIGDYFYEDGSYSTMLNPDKKVIGIVFQTDPSRIGQAEKDALKEKGINEPHGLVMAVKNAAIDLAWSTENKDFDELENCVSKEQCNDDISGLHNYNAVIDYTRTNNNLSAYPAFEAIDQWNAKDSKHKAPENTSGWYLPAVGQWYDFCVNLGGLPDWGSASELFGDYYWSGQSEFVSKVNAYFSPLGDGNYDAFSYLFYWSSSEYSDGNARGWNVYSSGGVGCDWDVKYDYYDVRPVLAF